MNRRQFLQTGLVSIPLIHCGAVARRSVLGSPSYPLDLGITWLGAWGMVPLSKAAANLFTLRRASDSTEQTFSRVGNQPDYNSIESFLSGTTGFIKTWVDQSGNGNDASHATAANQMQFYPHLNRLGISQNRLNTRFLTLPTAPSVTGRNFSIYTVFSVNDQSFSNQDKWPASVFPNFKFGSFGFYSAFETRTTSAQIVGSWTTFPTAIPMTIGNGSVNIAVYRSNTLKTRFRINGVIKDSATLMAATAAGMTTVNQAPSGYSVPVIYHAVLIKTASSDVEENQIFHCLEALFNTLPKTKALFFDGDSITAGQDESTNVDDRQKSWPYDLAKTLGDESVMVNNRAVAGSQIVDGTASPDKDLTLWAPTKLDAYLDAVYTKKILVVMAGSNDIGVINAAGGGLTTYNRLVAYCQARRTAGWGKIVVVNCIPRKDFVATINETERLDYNARITANALTDWDALVDASALNWQPGGASDWSTNYQGTLGIHPNAAGRSLLANVAKPVVQALL